MSTVFFIMSYGLKHYTICPMPKVRVMKDPPKICHMPVSKIYNGNNDCMNVHCNNKMVSWYHPDLWTEKKLLLEMNDGHMDTI